MTAATALSREQQARDFERDEDLAWLADTMARQFVSGGEVRTFWGPGHQELIDEYPDEWQAAIERARGKALPLGDVVVEREQVEKEKAEREHAIEQQEREPQPGDRLDGRTFGGNGRPKPAPRGAVEKNPALVPSVDEILALREQLGRKFEPADLTPGLRAASIAWLLSTKHEPDSWALDVALKVARDSKISDGQAKGALNVMTSRRAPTTQNAVAPEEQAPLSEGMYAKDGRFFRVLRSRESGRLYAKELVEATTHDAPVFGKVPQGRGTFEYAKGAIFELRPEDRMTLEQAAEYGQLHGWCCVCGRHLTDPKSVAAGIGPVCAGKV
jgi:hypothetical protein